MLRISAFSFRSRFSSAKPCSGAVPPVTFPPSLPPLHAPSAQVPPCHAGSGWLRKRTLPCGSLDRLLERDRTLDWDRRRLLDRDLGRPSEGAPSFLPRERLLDRDLDLERLFVRCDESRPSCRASAERLLERERVCVDWVRPYSSLPSDRFRSCLKMANNGASHMVGKLYFNVVQTKCFVFRHREVCELRSWWGKCLQREKKKVAVLRAGMSY
ncbi:hypothetical protein HPB50_018601 [Hyalomma asiaticum]|uniref:Uncharacterized protein n=1 Tax=Hyalomma asiaticum TaxID=266040 RepID=A0ACB7SIQ8_HYAAI|nr:hypothetical protein HPB50_018601 [Hyalomma asiaticum]